MECPGSSDCYEVAREGAPCEKRGNGGPHLRELAVADGKLTPRDFHRTFYEG